MSIDDTVNDALVYECDLAEPPEKVWRALTVPELVSQWLTREEPAANEDALECELIDADDGQRVSYLWRRGSEPQTYVTFEIEPRVDGGTHLTLTHSEVPLYLTGPVAMLKAA